MWNMFRRTLNAKPEGLFSCPTLSLHKAGFQAEKPLKRDTRPRKKAYFKKLMMLLQLLHFLGLIHLPNQHKSAKLDMIHRGFFLMIHFNVVSSICLFCISVLLRASGDMMEFLQKSLEFLTLLFFYGEIFMSVVQIDKLLELLHKRDGRFLTKKHKAILRDYSRQEMISVCFVTITVLATPLVLILRTFVELSPQELELQRTLYSKKHPERVLPVNAWIPYVDTSELVPYVMVWCYQIAVFLFMTPALAFVILQVTFNLTPLEAQFHILGKYFEQLGRNPEDPFEKYIWSDIGVYCRDETSGVYWLDSQFKGKTQEQIRLRYNDLCVDQCIRFSQLLYDQMNEFCSYFQPIKNITAIFACPVFMLCLYQAASQKLVLSNSYILIELLLVLVGVYDQIVQFERMKTCQDLLRSGISCCAYHRISARARRHLCVTLMRTNRPAHFKLMKGAWIIDYRFLMKLIKASYSFVNFMRVTHKTRIS